MRRRAALALLAMTPGCGRGCAESSPREPAADVARARPDPMPVMMSPRCGREIERAAVSYPPGAGAIELVTPTCAHGTLALFVVRGHTLTRVERATAQGSGFSPPRVISTGVDRLGPIAPDAIDGPVAWRSPLAGLDDERDDVWAARLSPADAGAAVLRGDALMPAGYVGLGIVAPGALSATGLGVYASFGGSVEDPSTARLTVRLGRDEPEQPREVPRTLPGELKAWESDRRVALARIEDGGATYLEATWIDTGAHARHRLTSRHALVTARGVSAAGRSAFLVGEFGLGRDDAGACVPVGDGVCVRAGALYVLLAGAPGAALERVEVAPRALPDSLAARGDELTALYVSPDEGPDQTTQRAMRLDVAHREATPLTFTPPQGFGAIDGPSLVGCDDGVWLAAQIAVPLGDDPDAATRAAVTALPLECLAR